MIDKDCIGILVAIYAGPVFHTHLRRLVSLRHQSKMNFASTYIEWMQAQIMTIPVRLGGGAG
jgi:hypothetical protein